MANNGYRWQTLPEECFRILHLNPGQGADPLYGSLETLLLDKSASYETISYAWGDRSFEHSIEVDGQKLSITQRASNALRRARDILAPRALWIDAVCIDQTNVLERGQQVARMQDIFAGSKGNIIYLGPHDTTTAAGIGVVAKIMTSISKEMLNRGSARKLFYDNEGRFRGPNRRSPVPSGFDDAALHGLYSRPWFKRLWVVQEAALSPYNECLCGKFTVPLYDLLAAAAWYRLKNFTLEDDHLPTFDKALMMFELVYAGEPSVEARPRVQHELGYYLYASRYFNATEPKDYVFALRGLLKNNQDERFWTLLEPDYSELTTLRQTFTNAFKAYMLEADSIVKPLRRVNHFQESDVRGKSFPSWVINLARRAGREKARMNIAAEFSNRFESHRGSAPQYKTDFTEDEVLRVKGVVLGTVCQVGPVFPRDYSLEQRRDFVAGSAEVAGCTDVHDEYCAVARKLALTLVAGIDSRRRPANVSTVDHVFSWLAWICVAGDPDNEVAISLTDDTVMEARSIYQAVERACSARRLFSTEEGSLFGLGPALMDEGDELVLLYEADLPCILRPTQYGERFHFVGSCYVDGMMQGEAFGLQGRDFLHRGFELV